jgi:HK97 gp10 family phage protein
MSNVDIKIQGLEAVFDLIDGVTDTQNVQKALGKCCAVVERRAKQLAPKDTGALRRSITSKVEGNEGIVFTPLEYAPYIEYGTGLFAVNGGRTDVPWNYQDDEGNWHSTSGQKPQPFMQPALDQSRTQIMDILKDGLTNG